MNSKYFIKNFGFHLFVFFLFFISIVCLNGSLITLPIHWDGTYFVRSAEWISTHNFNPFLPQEYDSGHPPFFYLFLAISWIFFGKSLLSIHLVMAGVASIGLYFLFLFLRTYISTFKSFIITFIVLLFPLFLSQAVLPQIDIFSLSLFLALLYFLKKENLIALTVISGIMIFSKEPNVFIYPSLYLYFLYAYKDNLVQFFKKSIILSIPIFFIALFYILKIFFKENVFHPAHFQFVNLKVFIGKILILLNTLFVSNDIYSIPIPMFLLTLGVLLVLFPLQRRKIKTYHFVAVLAVITGYILIRHFISFRKFNFILDSLEIYLPIYCLIGFCILTSFKKFKISKIFIFIFSFIILTILFYSCSCFNLPRYYLTVFVLLISMSFLFFALNAKKIFYIFALIFATVFILNIYPKKFAPLDAFEAGSGDELEINFSYQDLVKSTKQAVDFIALNYKNSVVQCGKGDDVLNYTLTCPRNGYVKEPIKINSSFSEADIIITSPYLLNYSIYLKKIKEYKYKLIGVFTSHSITVFVYKR